jgi:hypothetical protein
MGSLKGDEMQKGTMTKERWVEMFRASGMDEDAMQCWHREFESRHPQQHEEFLDWLQIPEQEIAEIRERCRR